MSSVVCFLLTFTLIIVNAVMGIFVGLDYYLMILAVSTLGLTFGLVLYNYKKIFFSKKKIRKNKTLTSNKVKRDTSKVNRDTNKVKRDNRRETINAKRKIS